MTLTPLYNPSNGPMRVVGLMSGSGSNLRKILEHERALGDQSPYQVVALFADNLISRARIIGVDFRLPIIENDIDRFYQEHGEEKRTRNMKIRALYDAQTVRALARYEAPVAALAGYMSRVTDPFMKAFLGVNVHPADLTILREDGQRKYRGDNAVRDAIRAGATELRSTTHIVEPEVDGGRILMVSAPLEVKLDGVDITNASRLQELADDHQGQLKKVGDWNIFPQTLDAIARGRYERDEEGALYFDGDRIPNGVRVDERV